MATEECATIVIAFPDGSKVIANGLLFNERPADYKTESIEWSEFVGVNLDDPERGEHTYYCKNLAHFPPEFVREGARQEGCTITSDQLRIEIKEMTLL